MVTVYFTDSNLDVRYVIMPTSTIIPALEYEKDQGTREMNV